MVETNLANNTSDFIYRPVKSSPLPPSNYVYHNAQIMRIPQLYGGNSWTASETANVQADIAFYTSMVGKNLYSFSLWIGEWNAADFDWALLAGAHSVLPLLTGGTVKSLTLIWYPPRPPYYSIAQSKQGMKDIASGVYDAYIIRQADYCKGVPYPLFMRWGAEMNINQSDWGFDAADYIAAWIHIRNVFVTRGVTNVTWIWNPNHVDIGANTYDDYYPGDAYVDWVGIDLYQWEDVADPGSEMDMIYNAYQAVKPIALCEWGTNSYAWSAATTPDGTIATPATQAYYMKKFFDAIDARPRIRMLSHFYTGVWQFAPTGLTGVVTGQVDTPNTTAEYASRIAASKYLS